MKKWMPNLLAVVVVSVLLFCSLSPVNAEMPLDIEKPAGHWIDVDLTTLTITAYDGSTSVYTAPFTAGKSGFETPTGSFRILRRVDHETMDSSTLGIPKDGPEGYYIKNVRYVQYFKGDGIGFHANYWMPDDVFGTANTSHGCVGMREADAKFFWDFADYGTPVMVHFSDKKVVGAVVGQMVADAKAVLGAAGFDVRVTEQYDDQIAPGTIISQQPDGGATIDSAAVTLVVSKGPRPQPTPTPKPRTVRPSESGQSWVPDVVGLPEADARKLIEQAGLSTTYINYQVESDVAADSRPFFRSVPAGSVVSVTPGVGTQLATGSAIKLAVRKP